MDRFWFTGDAPTFEVDGKSTWVLQSASVRLETEAEHLTGNKIGGTGMANSLALGWVQRFTAEYSTIERHEPRYAELAGIYRTFAVANLIVKHDDEFQASRRLGVLLKRYRVAPAGTPTQLPGLSRVEEARPERSIPGGRQTAYYCHTSMGGVDLRTTPLGPRSEVLDHLAGSSPLPTRNDRRPPAAPLLVLGRTRALVAVTSFSMHTGMEHRTSYPGLAFTLKSCNANALARRPADRGLPCRTGSRVGSPNSRFQGLVHAAK